MILRHLQYLKLFRIVYCLSLFFLPYRHLDAFKPVQLTLKMACFYFSYRIW